MRKLSKVLFFFIILSSVIFAQDSTSGKINHAPLKLKNIAEPEDRWAINILFSNNGFGLGGTYFAKLGSNSMGFAGLFFSGAKDSREFTYTDIFGDTYTPYKQNTLYMAVLNIGVQFRLFKNDVTDNLRPYINFGLSPTAVMYTPSNLPFFSSFKYVQSKYTVGAFVGVGLDYLTSKHSSLSMNARYYYINLLDEGIYSLSTEPLKYYGGMYLVFSYNFMH